MASRTFTSPRNTNGSTSAPQSSSKDPAQPTAAPPATTQATTTTTTDSSSNSSAPAPPHRIATEADLHAALATLDRAQELVDTLRDAIAAIVRPLAALGTSAAAPAATLHSTGTPRPGISIDGSHQGSTAGSHRSNTVGPGAEDRTAGQGGSAEAHRRTRNELVVGNIRTAAEEQVGTLKELVGLYAGEMREVLRYSAEGRARDANLDGAREFV